MYKVGIVSFGFDKRGIKEDPLPLVDAGSCALLCDIPTSL
jgi:hypothetical protein